MSAAEKKALLEERKKKWMSERDIHQLRDEVAGEYRPVMATSASSDYTVAFRNNSSSSSYNNSAASQRDSEGTDLFLNKLTDRLTSHIRDEIRREMIGTINADSVKASISDRIDGYLQSELSSHTCKICFEIMTSPGHTPILLFPCGHTFCTVCVAAHTGSSSTSITSLSSGGNKGCPYCRTPITSKAINQSLKELIDQFASKKKMLESGNLHCLDEAFPAADDDKRTQGYRDGYHGSSSCGGNGGRRGENSNSSSSSSSRGCSQYKAQLKSCEMRRTIIKNELDDGEIEVHQLRNKKDKILSAKELITEEKKRIETQMKQLQEEYELVNSHLEVQEKKIKDVTMKEESVYEKNKVLSRTIDGLDREIEKLSLLAEA